MAGHVLAAVALYEVYGRPVLAPSRHPACTKSPLERLARSAVPTLLMATVLSPGLPTRTSRVMQQTTARTADRPACEPSDSQLVWSVQLAVSWSRLLCAAPRTLAEKASSGTVGRVDATPRQAVARTGDSVYHGARSAGP